MLWFGAQDVLDGKITGGRLVAVRALRRVRAPARSANCRKSGARSAQAAGAAGRIAEILADRARDQGARRARAAAGAARGDRRFRRRVLRLSGAAGRRRPPWARSSASRPARRVAHRRPIGRRQEHRRSSSSCASTIPARAVSLIDGVDVREVDPAGVARAHRARAAGCRSSSAPPSRDNIALWPAGRQPTPRCERGGRARCGGRLHPRHAAGL